MLVAQRPSWWQAGQAGHGGVALEQLREGARAHVVARHAGGQAHLDDTAAHWPPTGTVDGDDSVVRIVMEDQHVAVPVDAHEDGDPAVQRVGPRAPGPTGVAVP